MWTRFCNSGWYEITVGALLVIALGLAFYVYGPQFGTGIDGLLGWIGGLSTEGKVLSGFALGLGILGFCIWQMNLLMKIER